MKTHSPHIIIVRHGESDVNVKKICGGWIDSPLTDLGKRQAHQLASTLKDNKVTFDICVSSILKRAVETRDIILSDLNLSGRLPITETWKLNECHSGALTGYTMIEAAKKFGPEILKKRFFLYDSIPPLVSEKSPYNPKNDHKYDNVEDRHLLPLGESLALSWERAEPFWKSYIENQLIQGKSILVVCHGNIIRAVMKYCENLTPEQAMERMIIPNCSALMYEYRNGKYENRQIIGSSQVLKTFKLNSPISLKQGGL